MSLHTLPDLPATTGTGHWTERGFKIANFAGSLGTIGFALMLLIGGQEYAFRVGNLPGPGMFPAVIGVALLGLGAAWFVGTILNRYRLDDEVEPPPDRSALIRAGLSFAVVCASAFAMQPLGYPVTMAFAAASLTLLGGGRWRAAILTGPLFAAATFLLVTTVLGIQLPTGILRPFLVGLL
jgi:Tripartite tricarboxylate transporter TctB family